MLALTEENKKKIQELERENKRLNSDGENKVAILSQECERLNTLAEKRANEIRALGGEIQEHQ